ncbi:sugar phosphate isomerase/epimerase family protein [Alteromonas antoniana]|uniref:sugar phosphate isomerase/epimerase family protein n=1 Tax=Alteromonas antoniana TaxID=2803813 RepID=UPI001C446CD3|nr:sugar phosphate isomerase/epimerase [Alteromonas antoniana]
MTQFDGRSKSQLVRRQFLKCTAGAFALATLPLGMAKAASTARLPVGLQLYTLRDMMTISVPATLELASAVGYTDMEFAGYFGYNAKQIKQLLNETGLKAPSAHIPLTEFEKGLDSIIEDAKTVGHHYVVLPYLTEAQRGTKIDTYYQLAEKLNRWGEALKKEDIQLAYHNHDFEFETRDGEVPYDVLLNETDAENVKMELDLYWTVKAKQDPLALFNQHPGRFPLWHVKDMDTQGEFADVGTGTIDFKSIFAHASKAGLEFPFVERDQTDDRLRTIRQGFDGLSALRK